MKKTRLKALKPIIKERNLGRENALGLAYPDGIIEIDPKQKSKQYLDTLIHEMLHLFLPDASENMVKKLANIMTNEIWKRNYRRILK